MTQKSEDRQFSVHSAIIKSLIKEQAGTLEKAFTELIMNSVDANATKIHIDIKKDGTFSISDDGKGFKDKDEIISFFETFGTPHKDGDACYGKFRVGRGQIMAFAKTTWTSGNFEMHVDLAGVDENFGYTLKENKDFHPGCLIKGTLYEMPYYLAYEDPDMEEDMFHRLFGNVEFLPIPVFVNGKQTNKLPSEVKWDFEDDFAYYSFDQKAYSFSVFNKGVFVKRIDTGKIGTGGLVTTKKSLQVNLARNEILYECETWKNIESTISNRFLVKLGKAKKLSDAERIRVIHDALYTKNKLPRDIKKKLFIVDIFGDLKSPEHMFTSSRYTLFNGIHTQIAEKVQNENLATVITPELLYSCQIDQNSFYQKLEYILTQFRQRFLGINKPIIIVPFQQFILELASTHSLIEEKDWTLEQQVIMKVLNKFQQDLLNMFPRKSRPEPRVLKIGISQTFAGWTDGFSYIAISEASIKKFKDGPYQDLSGGILHLALILIHEYCHNSSSVDNHGHDLQFYKKYHNVTLNGTFNRVLDQMFRYCIKLMTAKQLVPSSYQRSHVDGLAKYQDLLPRRKKERSDSKIS